MAAWGTKRILSSGFLLMGFTFTVTQGLLIRELLVAFFGNELSIGLVLGNWLILEAIGSGLLGKLADRWRASASSFAALQVLFALFLPLCLWAVYNSRRLVSALPGEGVGPVAIFASSFLMLVPLALVDGAMFAFGCRAYAALATDRASSIGRVYVYEALGAIAGGIVFTYLFIPFLYSAQIALLLSMLNLLSAALLLAQSKSKRRRSSSTLIALLVLLTVSFSALLVLPTGAVQRWFTRQQWSGHDLVYSENSVYGNVAVVQRQAQYTFYADGIPILTAPTPDLVVSEEIVHLAASFIPRPRRALVLGGGLGGVLHELAKYPWSHIDYAELDPLLIAAVRQFPTPLTLGELDDPRLKVEHVDGRLLVRGKNRENAPDSQARYDLVIVNLPYPSTLQLNRLYTVEFFQLVRGLLSDEGVVVISCPGTLSYMSQELRDLNLMACSSLARAFPHVRPIPGDLNFWLASPSQVLSTLTLEALIQRWEARGLETQLLSAPHIRLRMGQQRLDWFWTALEREKRLTGKHLNRDLHPRGLFYGLSYWSALFSPRLARVLALVGQLDLWTLIWPILGCGLLLLAIVRLTKKGTWAIVPIITSTGFSGMAADLLIIFAFQTLYGYVYHWIGLLITAFMAGLSLGGLLMTRRLARIKRQRSVLCKLELALVLYWALLPIAMKGLSAPVAHPLTSTLLQPALFLLNALAGFLVGAQFPLANRMWLRDREAVGGAAGLLYACDLMGAFVGAIVVSVLLIPVLGILETCLLAAALKLSSLALATALPARA
jgi:spermidine synthase